jgi:hypothetical protein
MTTQQKTQQGTVVVDTWRAFSLADAYKPRPPVQYVVQGLFELPSLSIVYGAPGTLKSFWLADLALCVAAGLPVMPPLPGEDDVSRSTLQVPVVWCDFDNGQRRTLERFDALGRARNVRADVPLHIFSMPSPWLDAGSVDSMGDLGDRVRALGAKLVIVDNLGAVTGGADENSSQMIQVLSNFRQVSEFTGAALPLIHHQRKQVGVKSREGDSLRGHSSIEAAIDLGLLVEREERSSLITVKSTKTRGLDVAPFGCTFTYEHDPMTGDLVAAKFWGQAIEDLNSDKAVEDAILEVVTDKRPINQTGLWQGVKAILPDVGKHRIRQVANGMVSRGKVVSTSGARGAVLYDLP